MSIRTELQRALKELERDIESPECTFRGEDYPCSISTLERGTTLVIGGKEVDIVFALRIRKAGKLANGAPYAFTAETAPKDGNTLSYDGITYRIARADDTVGAFIMLHLTSINK